MADARSVHATRHDRRLSLTSILSLIACTLLPSLDIRAAEAPQVNVTNIRRVFHNGEHNAFTDLVRFRDSFYLTFRSCPDGHMVHPTSSIVILRSDDARDWEQVHQFSVPLRDARDPHFLVFKEKLFVYTGCWFSGEKSITLADIDMNLHLGYAAWSPDGTEWHSPILLEGTFGHYIWRAAAHGDRAYLCGRRKIDFEVAPRGEETGISAIMLESDDGLIWRTGAMLHPTHGNETAFMFGPNGNVLAILRDGGNGAEVMRSSPPYVDWDRQELGRVIGGPLVARWGERIVVGGRKNLDRKNPKTSMYWLIDDQLQEFAEMPSAGDTSYPGFIALSDKRALMSWYSSHELDENGRRITAIYLADLEVGE